MDARTTVGITLGDPAGIGPEIVAAALHAAPREWRDRIVVYGDAGPLERGAKVMGVPMPDVTLVGSTGEVGNRAVAGTPDRTSGAAQVAYLEAAVGAAARGELGAIVTAPISKTWARRAGFEFLGHTEMLAARLGARDVAMFFVGPKLKVALTTVHRPLAEVVTDLTTDRVRVVVELVAASRYATCAAPLTRSGAPATARSPSPLVTSATSGSETPISLAPRSSGPRSP